MSKQSTIPRVRLRRARDRSDYEELAQSKRGKFVGAQVPDKTKCPTDGWECEKGHHWTASYHNISQVSWCPTCQGRGPCQKASLDEYRQLAQRCGGTYTGNEIPETTGRSTHGWLCDKKHAFASTYRRIETLPAGQQWCTKCGAEERLEEYRKLAREKGGDFVQRHTPEGVLEVVIDGWRCGRQHTFSASYTEVKQENKWCEQCPAAPTTALGQQTQISSPPILPGSLAPTARTLSKACRMVLEWIRTQSTFLVTENMAFTWSISPTSNKPLPFDLYVWRKDAEPGDMGVIVEVDGKHHFSSMPIWHSAVADKVKADVYKMQQAVKRSYSIIRIPAASVLRKRFEWRPALRDALLQYTRQQPVPSATSILYISHATEMYDAHKALMVQSPELSTNTPDNAAMVVLPAVTARLTTLCNEELVRLFHVVRDEMKHRQALQEMMPVPTVEAQQADEAASI